MGIDVDAMRHALRHERSESLSRRRRIVALGALGTIDFAIISLYQSGVIRHLPDLPGRLFDSDRVNASHAAYAFGHPDGTSGAAYFAATMALATFGGTRRTGRRAFWDLLTAGAAGLGALAGAAYLADMIFRERRACPYCLLGAAISFAMLPPALREAADAWRAHGPSHHE